ncbi:YecA family protein [Priestia megaterium]|uniref:YecA family protein n=1 Tax=Priestia megaterium TaxID=1404 RepID=UPI003B9FF4FF
MQNKGVFDAEEFDISFKAYISYVKRKLKKNPNYKIHPLVKAFLNAMEGLEVSGKPGNYCGLSGNADNDSKEPATQLFFCVLEAHKDSTISVLEFYDVIMNRPVPIKVLSYILVLAMKFDRVEGELINIDQSIEIINSTIPDLNYIRFNNNEWKKARDYFGILVKEGKVDMPTKDNEFNSLADDILKITYSTPWENYSPQVRSTIAQTWVHDKHNERFKSNCMNVVISSLDEEYYKVETLNNVLITLYGAPSEYFASQLNWTYFSDLRINEVSLDKRPDIKRNDPCPCNSGKKYKKCCG